MKIRSVAALSKDWRAVTCEIIELQKIPIDRVRLLLLGSFAVLHGLREKRTIPKSVCALLCEMQRFAHWVSSLENSPMYGLYPIFSTAIDEMQKEFISGNSNTKAIAQFLNEKIV